MNTAHTTTGLERLPPEVRLQIYTEAFRGAELYVFPVNMRFCSRDDKMSPFKLITSRGSALIRTCQLIRKEALPILNTSTTLVVPYPLFERKDPFSNIPDEFLFGVHSIRVDFKTFVHIDRRRLPSLKHVHLTFEVEGNEPLPKVVFAINFKLYGLVGFAGELMDGVCSWQWFMRQFALLGREEGFTVKLTALWSVYAEVTSGVEVEFDCERAVIASAKAFIGDHETPVNDHGQVCKDWKRWSGLFEE